MLAELGSVRRWAIQRNAIPHPLAVELDIGDVTARLDGASQVDQVDLPLLALAQLRPDEPVKLRSPLVNTDLAQIPVTVAEEDDWCSLHPAAIVEEAIAFLPAIDLPDISPGSFGRLTPPGCVLLRLDSLLFEPPGIVNLFEGLRNPGRAGKSYAAKGVPARPTLQESSTRQMEFATTSRLNRCRHGLQKDRCAICRDEAARASARKKKAKS
jgi:hypothetical protein